jgi:hypothetical protein
MSENVAASTSHNRKVLHDLYRENITLPYLRGGYLQVSFCSINFHIANIAALRLCSPIDGVSTLSWWWGLSAPEAPRAMLAVE